MRARGDDGAGVLSTFIGAVVFIVFVLFAAQLLLGLYLASIIGAVTYDTAKTAAGSNALASASSQAALTDSARRQLGRFGDAADFDWAMDDASVRLTVRVPRPPVLPGFLPFVDDTIERTTRVRAERVR